MLSTRTASNDHFVPSALTSSPNKASQSAYLASRCSNCTQLGELHWFSARAKQEEKGGDVSRWLCYRLQLLQEEPSVHRSIFSRFSFSSSSAGSVGVEGGVGFPDRSSAKGLGNKSSAPGGRYQLPSVGQVLHTQQIFSQG